MEKGYVIGLDCGTSAVKAAVWDCMGNMLGSGRFPLKILNPLSGYYEQDAESWITGVYASVSESIEKAKAEHGIHAGSIKALCISHQRETFVPVSANGAVSNSILWMDERAGPLLPDLKKQIDPEYFRRITGKTLSANLTFAKMYWLMNEEPDVFSEAEMFLDVQAYIVRALTGNAVTGYGSADPTGLYDMAHCEWSREILNILNIESSKLPIVQEPGSIAGTLSAEAAASCGLEEGIPIVVGLGDGQSAGLGCGIAGPGESYLSLGTSIVSGSYSNEFFTGPEFRISFGGIHNSFFLETVILSGAYTMDWFLQKFCSDADEPRLRREAALLPPGSQGLMLVPYWSSAMNPYWDTSARGITIGWEPCHGQAHFYRAILEGTALEQRLHTDAVEKALIDNGGHPIELLIVSGGGAQNELWLQIIADVTGRNIQKSAVHEAGSLGAAILAASAVGLHQDIHSAALAMSKRESIIVKPDPEARTRYDAIFRKVYTGLYPGLAESMRKLSEFK